MFALRSVMVAGSLLIGCAPAPEPQTEPAPAVDLYRLEADAGRALGLAELNARRLDSLSIRLDSLVLQLERTDSALSALPQARMEESLTQLTLLREDVQFLRSYLENQRKVPLINPPRKTVPKTLTPAPGEYAQAMAAFDKADYSLAVTLFETVPALYPANEWADDAWYWAGESYFQQGDYARAIAAFQKVLTYAVSDKHDDAQYGIGISYLRLGDRDRAAAELRKVEIHYPQSDRVPQARTELKKLQSR